MVVNTFPFIYHSANNVHCIACMYILQPKMMNDGGPAEQCWRMRTKKFFWRRLLSQDARQGWANINFSDHYYATLTTWRDFLPSQLIRRFPEGHRRQEQERQAKWIIVIARKGASRRSCILILVAKLTCHAMSRQLKNCNCMPSSQATILVVLVGSPY